jgi:hypothetical protein
MDQAASPTPTEPTPTTTEAPPPPLFAQSRSRGRQRPAFQPPEQRQPLDLEEASASASAPEPEPVREQPEPAAGPSSARRGSKPFADRNAVAEAVATSLRIGTTAAADHFAPPEAPEMFELTAEDEDRMVPPLAGLASRRVPATMAGSPDLADAIAGGLAFAMYVGRQLSILQAVRRERRAAAGGNVVPIQQHEAAANGAPDLTA